MRAGRITRAAAPFDATPETAAVNAFLAEIRAPDTRAHAGLKAFFQGIRGKDKIPDLDDL
jgi:hypothetical protein